MGSCAYPRGSIVVLTTEERVHLFRTALGDDVDAHFDPQDTAPLRDFMSNCANSGGKLIVLDEAHFIRVEDMVDGVQEYLDDPFASSPFLDVMIVCPEREAGDRLLAYCATYLGIYQIVYGCDGSELVASVAETAARPCTRRDVLPLICGGRPGASANAGASSQRRVEKPHEEGKAPEFPVEREAAPLGGGETVLHLPGGAGELVKITVKIEMTR